MTWDEIYRRADDCGYGSDELTAKDNARWDVRNLVLEKEDYDLEEAECPEDKVDYYCGLHEIRFYPDGRIDTYIWD